MTVLGQHRLGMELHTLDREFTVTQPHDDPVVGTGGDLQLGRHGLRLGGQRVVAGRGEGGRQSGEDTSALVLHQRRLAVQQLGRPVGDTAVRHLHRLHAEADAEDGDTRVRAVADHVDADAGLLGSAGAG